MLNILDKKQNKCDHMSHNDNSKNIKKNEVKTVTSQIEHLEHTQMERGVLEKKYIIIS